MGIKYDWRNLELVSYTSMTNILTFIQFALVPLSKTNVRGNSSNFSVINFLKVNKILLRPIELIEEFNAINPPMRCLLSAVIIIAFINLMTYSFFFPTYRLLIYAADLFLPGMLLLGICWKSKDYEPVSAKVNAPFIILGLIWILVRIAFSLWPLIKNRHLFNWKNRTTRLLTAIFLERIKMSCKKNIDEDFVKQLDEDYERCKKLIQDREPAINWQRYPKWRKILDIAMAGVLMLIMIILSVSWGSIIKKSYQGINYESIVICCKVVTAVFAVFFGIRLLLAILYFFDKTAPKLVELRRLAFKGIIILTTLVIIPVCNLLLRATDLEDVFCEYNQYYYYNQSGENFIEYFMEHIGSGCQVCNWKSSYWTPCMTACRFNATLAQKAGREARYLSEFDVANSYTIPMVLIQVFFLFILIQIEFYIFKQHRTIIEFLPAPTTDLDAKFTSVVKNLHTSGGYVFESYTHKHSMFNFDFTQFKAFVLFATSVFPIFPSASVSSQAPFIITVIFTAVCALICIYNLVQNPYKSRLHNVVNTVDYLVSTITSLIACIATKLTINPVIGTVAYFAVFIVPFVVTFVSPFFIKFDPSMRPVKYALKDIMRKQKKFRLEKNRKKKKKGEQDFDLEDSESSSGKEDPDFTVGDFDSIAICPTYIQIGRASRAKNYEPKVRKVWTKFDLKQGDLDQATKDIFDLIDEMLDSSSFIAIDNLLGFATIYSSICLGWGVGNSIALWKTDEILYNSINPYCGEDFDFITANKTVPNSGNYSYKVNPDTLEYPSTDFI
ncbi:hypothetical protein TVAG_412640 [Trichomonas vaginalis G3]|uniref:TRP C-terminal domain-containing protein n=1 Tax=Trichomonas vaginalis (strain ATCC PRA-98 / G3) TaxID=412133 RepID=A2EV77_TRIV3|nr:hypothetical protein TVAGG3_0936150 [Trichomonas vaginalis G3]EAY03460.1 hypothetical protein TVAG_412640 [Trichomonas vaginalis G3]KAI5486194.1 hypothetical protein TVAGG3_0936150 [Trichomonas vaginalis G3]|eukprot:XP_001315683.1 hypothetical protein [Trichomonas vaginalis G3]